MKKLTIEYVRSEFEKEGYVLLSDVYYNVNTPLEFKCPNGHTHKIAFSCWRKGQRCAKCTYDSLRLDLEYVKKSFEKERYILVDDYYINSLTKIALICPNGHNIQMTWSNWKKGHRCKYCAKNVRFNIEFIKESFEKEGYTLLSDEYVNNHTKLDYICSKSHKHSITFTDWYNGGYRCPTCYAIKISGAGNYGWKGGISFEPYCEIWKDREYKQDIRDRDGNRCLNPYCDSKNPNDLTIHHIDYNKKIADQKI